jgi:uncharacterized membrane protein YraQ (UPF0718 family)/copper chaperone CopZ
MFLHEFIMNVWHVLHELAPWLLLGATIAGLLHIFLPTDFVRRHLGQGNLRNVVKAALFGVPMPLCSCGVIPAAIGLKKDGASDGASVSFLISTPQTGVDSIMVSAAFLGLPFALFKVISAFLTGLIGGVLTNLTEPPEVTATRTPERNREGCKSVRDCAREWRHFTIDDLLYSIWKWIVIGILVSAAITTTVGDSQPLADKPWAMGLAGMFLMLLISMPLYVCATASVPIAASLVVAGMPVGAALVFLMAGPATNVATLGAVYSEFGRRVTAIYVAIIAGGSILFGWLFDLFFGGMFRPVAGMAHKLGPFALVTAILLILLFLYFALRDIKFWLAERKMPKVAGEEMLQLQVSGMTCEGCARNVRNALLPQHGVHGVDIDLKAGTVTVSGHGLHTDELAEAVREAGYGVE